VINFPSSFRVWLRVVVSIVEPRLKHSVVTTGEKRSEELPISRSLLRRCSLVVLLFVLGCLPMKPAYRGQAALPISDDLDAESLHTAIRGSIAFLQKLPPDRVVGEQPRRTTAKDILDSLFAFEKVLLAHWHCAHCLAREITARFDVVPSSADPALSEVLFTGYYQPVIEGSFTPTAEHRYPLYRTPPDLIAAERVTLEPKMTVERVMGRAEGEQFVPYYTRREIDEAGALRGRGLEIAWVKDPVELFFLHIQGSGIVSLPDGGRLNVGYAAQNGRPYRSIGRLLIDNGKVAKEEMSMQRLRRYFAANPGEQSEIFAHNESYVFFRVNQEGPLGSLEVPVTAGRSVATDDRLFPKGAIAFIQTEIPVIDAVGQLAGWRPIARFVLNQDTGGAIRGLQRADIYFGTGAKAAGLAGYMNRSGKMFFLLLKEDPSGAKTSDSPRGPNGST
jgi:membrane-bound lytic murein transglycosylase A